MVVHKLRILHKKWAFLTFLRQTLESLNYLQLLLKMHKCKLLCGLQQHFFLLSVDKESCQILFYWVFFFNLGQKRPLFIKLTFIASLAQKSEKF